MKRLFTLLVILTLCMSASQLSAQSCDPDTELPDSVIVSPLPFLEDFPDRGIADTACINGYFETVIQFQLPETAVILGNEVAINGATVATEGAVSGVPAGFNYNCNPPNCEFEPGEVGCLIVFGTAVEGEEDIYDVSINVTIDIGIPFNTNLPDNTIAPGNYFLHVQPEGSPNCTIINDVVDFNADNGINLKASPNPAADRAMIEADLPAGGTYTLRVVDMLGRKMIERQVLLGAGQSRIDLDASVLAPGMYVFTLDDGEIGASGRLIVR